MGEIIFEQDESVAVVTLNSGENRFNPDFINDFIQTLDMVEKETDARTLVVRSAHDKIFSNGIDTDWLVPFIQKGDLDTVSDFFKQLNQLFRKTLLCPMVTVAAMTGHAFAGGAIWSCAFDFRFMRSDRGFLCLPEVDLGMPLLPGMLALLGRGIPAYKLEEMEYTGIRLTAEECLKHHIVHGAFHIDDLMNEVMKFAGNLNKKRGIIREMKQRTLRHIVHALDVEDIPFLESRQWIYA